MIYRLFEIIEMRKTASPEESYTARLITGSEERILRKINEEAMEVVLAAKGESNERLLEEVADLLYHTLVLISSRNLKLSSVDAILEKRHHEKNVTDPT